jgi:hypothetical protein
MAIFVITGVKTVTYALCVFLNFCTMLKGSFGVESGYSIKPPVCRRYIKAG